MRFGAVPVGAAQGAILAHSLAVAKGRIRKGRVLDAADLAALAAAGHDPVTVARLDPGDIGEDAAATLVAAAMVPDPAGAGLRLTTAATGRVNVYATGPGVLGLDVAAIEAANRVDPMITIATLPNLARTRDRGMVATVKIIAYGVAEQAARAAADRVRGAMRVHPVRLRSATLIQTEIGRDDPGKGEAAMAARLAALGMELTETRDVPHATAPLAAAVAAATGDLVLILTASATSDP
ncbi:MAG: molybdopterin biosynthesis protein, partial [Paracoccaceae bacterium]